MKLQIPTFSRLQAADTHTLPTMKVTNYENAGLPNPPAAASPAGPPKNTPKIKPKTKTPKRLQNKPQTPKRPSKTPIKPSTPKPNTMLNYYETNKPKKPPEN